MNRYFFRTCLAIFLLMSQIGSPNFAGAYQASNMLIVTNLNDSGAGSLRQAVLDAPDGGTITFAQGLSGSIPLEKPIDLVHNVSINGTGIQGIIIDGQQKAGGFFVREMITVNITNIRFINSGSTTSSITNVAGFIRLQGDTFYNDNSAFGGAIYNLFNGTVGIYNSKFENNNGAFGGAIGNFGITSITNSTFENNKGSISNSGALLIAQSTFHNNRNRGIQTVINLYSAQATIVNSTFSSNSGAIENSGTIVSLNTTFYNNSYSGKSSIYNFDIGTMVLKNTIIVSDGRTCEGKVQDGSGNIQFPGNDCGKAIVVGDPKLYTLSNNGGITQTMALPPTSIAIKAGSSANCQDKLLGNVDQRAVPRESIANCDAGSFQLNVLPATEAS